MKTPQLAALAALLLSGCGKAPGPQTSVPRPSPGPAAVESRGLRILCRPGIIAQTVIDQFTKETGIAVSVENCGSKEEMLAKLLYGERYDIIQTGEEAADALVRDGLLQPINHAKIPNLKKISPKFLNKSFDPGNKFSIPFLASPVGIVVNTGKIPNAIRGFADVFAEKNNQDIAVLDDARELVAWGFFVQGTPINQVTDESLEKVKPLLARWLRLVKVFGNPASALLNGDAAIGIVGGGEAAVLVASDKKFQWVIPVEGTHLALESLAIPKSADNVSNAGAFLNFLLRPEISNQVAGPFLNPNAAALKLLPPEQRSNPASFPSDGEVAKMQTFEDAGEQSSKIDGIITTLKNR